MGDTNSYREGSGAPGQASHCGACSSRDHTGSQARGLSVGVVLLPLPSCPSNSSMDCSTATGGRTPGPSFMIGFGRVGLWMAARALSCQRLETFYPPLLHWPPHLGRKSSQGHRTPWCPPAQLLDELSCQGGQFQPWKPGGGNLPSMSRAQEREDQCAEGRLEGG